MNSKSVYRTLISTFVAKLEHLRTFTLPDYLATLYHATKEFKELEELIPNEREVEELLERGVKRRQHEHSV